MEASALAALTEKINAVMILSIVSIGMNILLTGLVISALIVGIVYIVRKNNRRGE